MFLAQHNESLALLIYILSVRRLSTSRIEWISYLDPLLLDDTLGFRVVIKVHRLPVSGGVVIIIRAKEPGPETTSANSGFSVFVLIGVVAAEVGSEKVHSHW